MPPHNSTAKPGTEDGLTTIPTTGEQFRFLTTGEDLIRVDWFLPPDGGSPRHIHPCQVERVTGVEGELIISWRKGQVTVRAGDSFTVPAGRPHEFKNRSHETAHMVVDFIPALLMREFFEATAGLAAAGLTDDSGRPRNPLMLAAFARGFRNVFAVTTPPRWLQAILLTPLALVARTLGYHPHQPHYVRNPQSPEFDVDHVVREAKALGRV